MSKPYIRYTQREPSASGLLFSRIAQLNGQVMRSRTVEERRRVQLVVAEVRIIPPTIICEEITCDDVPCEWVYPRRRQGLSALEERVIIYLHGGSWAFGSLESARPVSVLLAERTGYGVLMASYRLSPENPYPAGLEDCYKVYKWLLRQGYRPEQIGLMGDSAGGNLALCLMNRLKAEGETLPACMAGASPVTDMRESSAIISSGDDLIYTTYEGEQKDIFSLYLAEEWGDKRDDPLISPIMGDLKGFPPILIHAGGDEPIAEDNIAFVEEAVSQGVDARIKIWKGMFHDFSIVGNTLRESRESMREIAVFFQKHMGG